MRCTVLFPAATYDGMGGSPGGPWPCAELLSEVSNTQLGAWPGDRTDISVLPKGRLPGKLQGVPGFEPGRRICFPILYPARRPIGCLSLPSLCPQQGIARRRDLCTVLFRTPESYAGTFTEPPANFNGGDRGSENPWRARPPFGPLGTGFSPPGDSLVPFSSLRKEPQRSVPGVWGWNPQAAPARRCGPRPPTACPAPA